MGLSATVLMGIVGATVMYRRRAADSGDPPTLTLGGLFAFTAFLAFLVAPMFQMVGIGTQLTEALAGLDRTQEVLRERPEDEDPNAHAYASAPFEGNVEFDNVSFEYEPGKPVLHDVSFSSEPGTVTALVGPSGSGKSTIISLIAAFHEPTGGHGPGGWHGPLHRAAGRLPLAARRGAAGHVPVRRHDSREHRVSRAPAPPRSRFWRRAASPAWTSSRRGSRRSTTPSWASAA